MNVVQAIDEIRKELDQVRARNETIGFVPTMGYFHEGHLSLMRAAREETDVVVASVFVNPTQFGPDEDFEAYPRNIERDRRMAEEVGVDYIFAPSEEEMYSQDFSTSVQVHDLTDRLCGASRPGHFEGVTTVVTKLFHIIDPDWAYFGQKDAQQAAVLQRMVRDLNFDLDLRIQPIVREPDGLATSSRNEYLDDDEREAATILYQSLEKARSMVEDGIRDAKHIQSEMRRMVEEEPLAEIDYVEIVGFPDLEPVDELSGDVLFALAVFIGETRLIDNILLEDL